jgi:GntR family transcriptional regulator
MTNQSISQRLHDNLRQIISATQPGERLPSEPELAQHLGVSRATLREAMRTFETQGLLRRRQGSGTYVTHPTHIIESGLEVLESIETLARRIGLPVTMGALQVDLRPPTDDECRVLKITCDIEVIKISRIILANERPVAFLIDILPQDILSPEDIENNPVEPDSKVNGYRFTGSVLDLLLRRGEPELMVSRTEIGVTTATHEVARSMGIQRGDVLLHFVAELYTTSGRVIDYSYSYFLPGYFRFHVVRRVG